MKKHIWQITYKYVGSVRGFSTYDTGENMQQVKRKAKRYIDFHNSVTQDIIELESIELIKKEGE